MTYRHITVDGITYQYTIGKQFTKIKSIGVVDNTILGTQIDETRVAVTPASIAEYIRTGTVTPKPAVKAKTLAEMAAAEMREIAKEYKGDPEAAHCAADGLLLVILRNLGYGEMVDEYHKIDKWYA
jgi:hypothetical protein